MMIGDERSRVRRRWPVLLVMLCCLGCDQASKQVAVAALQEGQRSSYLGDLVRLELVRNPGAFLSLGAGLGPLARTLIFTWGVAALTLLAAGFALRRSASRAQALGAALVAGGGAGNLVDRVLSDGRVIDFLNLGIGSLRTGIFNVADMALMAGVATLVLWPQPKGSGAGGPGALTLR